MYTIYQLLISLLFYAALPILLLFVLVTGKHRRGLKQRLGLYKKLPEEKGMPRIWLHAASVGEVLAAKVLFAELQQRIPEARFVVTTMTIHGRDVAREQFPADVVCLLAPLDVPGIVDRVLTAISPDIYVCIETELWPVLLRKVSRRCAGVFLANGRMSEKSAAGYAKKAWFFRQVLANFDHMAFISKADEDRYLALGGDASRMTVSGNLKFDKTIPADAAQKCQRLRDDLAVDEKTEVFIAGSTHTGEEEILLPVFRRLAEDRPTLWVVAPRHLQRLEQLKTFFDKNNVGVDLFSELRNGATRHHQVVLLDSFGELSLLYGIGTYIFCGGSLVEKRGHNIMEAALWDRAVLYGRSMADFRDAVELLESVGAGFPVQNGEELCNRILSFREHPAAYQAACRRAGEVARSQQGAAGKQAAMIAACISTP